MIDSEVSARFGVAQSCPQDAMLRFDCLIAALRVENQIQNLVAKNSLLFSWQRHVADSLQILDHVPRGTSNCLDLGSGAGFPGLVLAIARTSMEVHLVESRRLRTVWLERMVSELELSNARVHGSTVANVPTFEAQLITARAFAPLPKLLGSAARFSTERTVWVLPKGRSAAQEVTGLPKELRSMFHVKPSRTDTGSGIVVGQGRVEAAQ